MAQISTAFLSATPKGVAAAADLLRDGALVSFPTETVYGLGGDATNNMACAGIFEAKGRPTFNPLIVHVPDLASVERFAALSETAKTLANAFWPGPLTLVLPLLPNHGLSELVSAGLPTVAVRVPAHPLAQDLLRAVGKPIAAPSANPSGKISPTTASHVMAGLNGKIAAVLDGGPCSVGLESTIIGASDTPVLLRSGGLAPEKIEAALGYELAEDTTPGKVSAPGQLSSHYAPNAALSLNVTEQSKDATFIGYGAMEADLNLSPKEDLTEAAANLFAFLHRADAMGRAIEVAPIPNHGLGRAINDRLQRAAAPRA